MHPISPALPGQPVSTVQPAPALRNPLLQIGTRIATLLQRGEVEGVIIGIDEAAALAAITLTSPAFAGRHHIERLAYLVPIGADGRPLDATPEEIAA